MNVDQEEDAPSGVVIWVPGIPRPQPRPRFVGRGVVSTTGKAKAWAAAVEKAGREAVRNLGGPDQVKQILGEKIRIQMAFIVDRRRTRADVDNLAKLVMDRLMGVGALGGDDSRVVEIRVQKIEHGSAAAKGMAYGAAVLVMPALDAPSGAQEAAGEPRPGWLVSETGRKPEAL